MQRQTIGQIIILYLLLPLVFSPILSSTRRESKVPSSFESQKITHNKELEKEIENMPKESSTSSLYISPKIKDVPHRGYLVKFKDVASVKDFDASLRKSEIESHTFTPLPFLFLRGKLRSIITKLKQHPKAISLFPNQLCRVPKVGYPNKSSSQINLTSIPSAKRINAPDVWKQGYRGQGIKIAIIDTGVNHHQALEGRFAGEKSFVKEKYGYKKTISNTQDEVGHGTAVAGIAAGDGKGVGQGVAPKAKILNAKVFPDDTTGATDAGIIAAIEWAVEKGAHVINLSLGRPPLRRDPLEEVVNKVAREGVTVVAAAGNNGDLLGLNTMSIASPGTARNAITVGALGAGNSIAAFSSRGPTPDMAVKPDVIAPGVAIGVISSYNVASGTSFAAPHVAGAAALLLDFCVDNGERKTEELSSLIKASLMKTSKQLWGDELIEGGGKIDAESALRKINQSLKTSKPLLSVLPRKLPINSPAGFPYFEKLYYNTTRVFNFTLCTPKHLNLSVELAGNISDVITLNAFSSINTNESTTYWEMNFTVVGKKETYDYETGEYSGEIHLLWNTTPLAKIPMNFTLVPPTGRMLFDLKHTSWPNSAKYGQYHRFYHLADERNLSVRHYFSDSPHFSFPFLKQFDIIFMPDALSNYIIETQQGKVKKIASIGLTKAEKNALYKFTKHGGLIIFISMSPGYRSRDSNRAEVNGFLKEFKVKIGHKRVGRENANGEAKPIKARVNQRSLFGMSSPDVLPFWGTNVVPLDWKSVPVITFSSDIYDLTLATFQRKKKGGIFISGSNFFFDNWAFTGNYQISRNKVKKFSKRLLSWPLFQSAFSCNYTVQGSSKGAKVNFTVTYNGSSQLVNSSVKAYSLDAIGMRRVNLTRSGLRFSGSYLLRHRGTNHLLLSARFGRWLFSRRFNLSIPSQEETPPSVTHIKPKNGSIKRFEFPLTLSSLNIQLKVIDEESGVLEQGIQSRVRNSNGTTYNVLERIKRANNDTTTIFMELPTKVILDGFPSQKEKIFILHFRIPDQNLNWRRLTLVITLKQKVSFRRWIAITGLSVGCLIGLIAVHISSNTKKKLEREVTIIK